MNLSNKHLTKMPTHDKVHHSVNEYLLIERTKTMKTTYAEIVNEATEYLNLCRVGELQHLDALNRMLIYKLIFPKEIGTTDEEITSLRKKRSLINAQAALQACREGRIDPHAAHLQHIVYAGRDAYDWCFGFQLCTWHTADLCGLEPIPAIKMHPEEIGTTYEEVSRYFSRFLQGKIRWEGCKNTVLEDCIGEIKKHVQQRQNGTHHQDWWSRYHVSQRLQRQMVQLGIRSVDVGTSSEELRHWMGEDRVLGVQHFWRMCLRQMDQNGTFEQDGNVYYPSPEYVAYLLNELAEGMTLEDMGIDEERFRHELGRMAKLVAFFIDYWKGDKDYATINIRDGFRAFFELCEKHGIRKEDVGVTEADIQTCERLQGAWQYRQDAETYRRDVGYAKRTLRMCRRLIEYGLDEGHAKIHYADIYLINLTHMNAEDLGISRAEYVEAIACGLALEELYPDEGW